ncbi:hypothetical protein PHJA_002419000 [Phtheirospermum japonicum]|uniref:Uncharacterized protein n=1 Tax=Phtheirospermum japonicum TaxID=374723 RepID=A0A830CSB8_9LAMI|nr:hypothetical protein PHJA_002419000 [Phtheirospermum japonicum]
MDDKDSEESGAKTTINPNCLELEDAHKVLDKMPEPTGKIVQADSIINLHNLHVSTQKEKAWVSLVQNRDVSMGETLNLDLAEDDIIEIREEWLDNVDEAWFFCLAGKFAAKSN